MTDFEMMSLVEAQVNTCLTLMTVHFSVVFAFIVASFMAAGKLSRALAIVAIALFTLVTGFFALLVYGVLADATMLMAVIREAVANGESSLGWVRFAQSGARTETMATIAVVIVWLSYAGAMYFFMHQRRKPAHAV